MPKPAIRERGGKPGDVEVFAPPGVISGIHRDYGLWIFSFGREVRHPTNRRIAPRRFKFYGISHLLSGRGFLWTPGCEMAEYAAGDAVFSPPGMVQDYGGCGSEYVEDSICFTGPVADALLKSGVITPGIAYMGMERRLLPVFDMVSDPSRDAQLKANMLLQRLLLDIHFENKERATGRRPSVASVTDALAADPGRNMPVKEMAELCGLSESQFRRDFIAETGLHPKAYVDKCKMRLAAEMLVSRGMSVREAAAKAGYADPYHFSRRFKQVMGMPPGEYRKRMSLSGTNYSPPESGI